MTLLTTHAACGKSWKQRGNRTGHCSGCHETFEGLSLFDAHRRGGVCADPREMKVGGLPLRFDGTNGDGSWWADTSRLKAAYDDLESVEGTPEAGDAPEAANRQIRDQTEASTGSADGDPTALGESFHGGRERREHADDVVVDVVTGAVASEVAAGGADLGGDGHVEVVGRHTSMVPSESGLSPRFADGSDVRILTVRQPWAWAIIHGGKDVENRVRNIAGDYRGPVLIHAARGKTAEIDERQERLLLAADEDGRGGIADWLDGEPIIGGVILGVVDLVAVHRAEGSDAGITADFIRETNPFALNGPCSPWAEANAHHLVFENPRALDQTIPYRGALGLRKTEFAVVGDYLAAPWDHGPGQCTPMGCEPGCHLEPVGHLVATS